MLSGAPIAEAPIADLIGARGQPPAPVTPSPRRPIVLRPKHQEIVAGRAGAYQVLIFLDFPVRF
jgi:hypothetical protein